jgi:hypothetical protein
LGSCFIPASNAVLHASLSSAFLTLRQVVISSALGINALQSLNTSGVHAMRCASVPCEKEGAGEAVANSKASDTHHRVRDISRSGIQLFWLSMFIIGSHPQSRAIRDIVIMADGITRLLELALGAKRRPLELSTSLQCFRCPKAGVRRIERIREPARFGLFRHQHRSAQTSKSSHVCPSVGNDTNANVSC